MVQEVIIEILKNFLEAISLILLGGCLLALIFNRKEVEKSANSIALALIVSLSLVVITWDNLELRIAFGYIILIGMIYILAKEMRKKKKRESTRKKKKSEAGDQAPILK